MRCTDCRQEKDLFLTPWEKIKLFFFHKFHEELQDFGGEKFTQGFGDGYKHGFEAAKERNSERIATLEATIRERSLPQLDPIVDLYRVLDVRPQQNGSHRVFVGGTEISAAQIQLLKAEAIALQHTKLWGIMQETMKQKAIEKSVLESKSWEEVIAGKMMLHCLGILRSICTALETVKTEPITPQKKK